MLWTLSFSFKHTLDNWLFFALCTCILQSISLKMNKSKLKSKKTILLLLLIFIWDHILAFLSCCCVWCCPVAKNNIMIIRSDIVLKTHLNTSTCYKLDLFVWWIKDEWCKVLVKTTEPQRWPLPEPLLDCDVTEWPIGEFCFNRTLSNNALLNVNIHVQQPSFQLI